MHPLLADLREDERAAFATYLEGFVSEKRRAGMAKVLGLRTRALTVVLENVFQPHNASAVLRSCECFGVQDVHLIEDRYAFRPSKGIALGAAQWLSLHHYKGAEGTCTPRCLDHLRTRGYRIAATTLGADAVPLHELPTDTPLALCFGTERHGLSTAALDRADLRVHIPMVGFTESFNISVSCALSLYELAPRIRRDCADWALSQSEKEELYRDWLVQSVARVAVHLRRWREEHWA